MWLKGKNVKKTIKNSFDWREKKAKSLSGIEIERNTKKKKEKKNYRKPLTFFI